MGATDGIGIYACFLCTVLAKGNLMFSQGSKYKTTVAVKSPHLYDNIWYSVQHTGPKFSQVKGVAWRVTSMVFMLSHSNIPG